MDPLEILNQGYQPEEIESRWAKEWAETSVFHADEKSGKPPFSIVIPPPNVTGSLHLGHALNNTLQDVLCRYRRALGDEVLWMPGTDHAGIATQNVVERQLAQEGMSRQQLGREAFVERVWRWKESSGGTIISQLKRMGCSCDWKRERFTMDEGLSRAVRTVFVKLYKEGLIYRGNYMIHWCPRCESALADLEVEYPDELEDGFLYRLAYPLIDPTADGTTDIIVDTTRPETMLGDTAVAVHPEDERYKALIGKTVRLPLVGREIPIIADAFVDREFGTGAVKVTPGHDPNDFEAGRRHNLPIVSVIGSTGKMTEAAGIYAGMDRFECRELIIKDLTAEGVLIQTTKHQLKTGRCYRCHSIVEPLVSTQWFVRTKTLADQAMTAVRDGRTKIVPESWAATYFQWLENIRDWCISRQLWWGHQIPVWYCGCGEQIAAVEEPKSCSKCGTSELRQDPDVLDTWFSSALWPFSTMGWPDETETLRKFYPTSVLVTGFDILFFWVARMMMMGLKLTGEVPFSDIFLHAMVRDEHGQKMSKTKGNVIDPLEIIKEYGADALRFTLAIMTVQGRDVNLSTSRIAGYRNFINKIWNASRFVLLSISEAKRPFSVGGPADLGTDLFSRWLRSRLCQTIEDNRRAYGEYQFSELCTANYRFFWDDFCSWYLEIAKVQLRAAASAEERQAICTNLLFALDLSLRLLNPVVPFVTEEIYRLLPEINGAKRLSLNETRFPDINEYGAELKRDLEAEAEMALAMEVVTAIRTVRSEKNVPPGKEVECRIAGDKDAVLAILRHKDVVSGLCRLSSIEADSGEKSEGPATTKALSRLTVSVMLSGAVDVEKERERIGREIKSAESELARVLAKLSSESFRSRAPAAVVEKEELKRREHEERLKLLRSAAAELE